MKKPKNATKSFQDLKDLGEKYGVEVTDMSKRGIRAIGFLSGIKKQQKLTMPSSVGRDRKASL